ncbi:MAG: radical SAM protein [bacterium]|nr:radical SAM protein [bacterium]
MKWINPTIKGLRRGIQRLPLNSSVEIRITRLCSQRCRQCSVYQRKTIPATMSWENFQIAAERLRNYGAHIGFISGGEATLVPDLDKILIEAKRTFPGATTLVTGLVNQTDIIKGIGKLALENNINIQTSLDGLGKLGDSLRGVSDFSTTVLGNMKLLATMRGNSKSLLYANVVLNNLNLDQLPELIARARALGWMTTIGLYHTLTATTRDDHEMQLQPGKRLDKLLDFLENNDDILNLNSFIRGIKPFVEGKKAGICPFVDSPFLSTRTTIMENGDVHLCFGAPIGNIFESELGQIFSGSCYHTRLKQYRQCPGCWTTCYTQRHLLTHPRSLNELRDNYHKIKLIKASAGRK